MSKQADNLIKGLRRRLISIQGTISEMQGNVEILNRESEPEAYRRWYLSYHAVQNLEGDTTEALERLSAYYAYKKLPWWKRMFKRSY